MSLGTRHISHRQNGGAISAFMLSVRLCIVEFYQVNLDYKLTMEREWTLRIHTIFLPSHAHPKTFHCRPYTRWSYFRYTQLLKLFYHVLAYHLVNAGNSLNNSLHFPGIFRWAKKSPRHLDLAKFESDLKKSGNWFQYLGFSSNGVRDHYILIVSLYFGWIIYFGGFPVLFMRALKLTDRKKGFLSTDDLKILV